jgi:hypothetical protein
MKGGVAMKTKPIIAQVKKLEQQPKTVTVNVTKVEQQPKTVAIQVKNQK